VSSLFFWDPNPQSVICFLPSVSYVSVVCMSVCNLRHIIYMLMWSRNINPQPGHHNACIQNPVHAQHVTAGMLRTQTDFRSPSCVRQSTSTYASAPANTHFLLIAHTYLPLWSPSLPPLFPPSLLSSDLGHPHGNEFIVMCGQAVEQWIADGGLNRLHSQGLKVGNPATLDLNSNLSCLVSSSTLAFKDV
jgi:hypothetical protein